MQKKHSSCCTVHVDIHLRIHKGAYINKAGAAKRSTIHVYIEIENQWHG